MIDVDLDPNVRLALLSVPDKSIFSRPMSKKARILLHQVLKWGYNYTGKCFKTPTPAVDCYKMFASQYLPIIFDDACHRFDMSSYITHVDKAFKPNKAENLLGLMQLKNLDDASFVADIGLKSNPNKVGNLRSTSTSILYEWITNSYLLTDFTESDLNKISILGDERYDLNLVKSEAANIHDVDKRNVSYLYAIIRDVIARNEAVRSRELIANTKNDEVLKGLFTPVGPKPYHEVPDKSSDWAREREWLDAMRDFTGEDT